MSEQLTIEDLAGLFGRFEEDLRQSLFVKNIAAAASATLDPEGIARAFLKTAIEAGGVGWGAVFTTSEGRARLLAADAAAGASVLHFAPAPRARQCVETETRSGRLPANRPPHLVSAVGPMRDHWLSGSMPYGSHECVEVVLGFPDADAAPHSGVFEDMLARLASALRNAGLYHVQERAARLARVLDEADVRMLGSESVEAICDVARASIGEALGAMDVELTLPQESDPRMPQTRSRLRVKSGTLEARFRVMERAGLLRARLAAGTRSIGEDERDFVSRLLSNTALAIESRMLQLERDRLMRAREEWVADLSHDIRTPLASIRGYAELLSTGSDIPEHEVQREAGLIARQAKAIERLVEDLHSAFRLRCDVMPVTIAPADLVPLTEEALEIALWHAGRGRHEVPFEHPPGAVVAMVDQSHYQRIVTNLATNAFVHNPPETRVWAVLRTDDTHARITVADSGLGMDAELAGRVHERGERGTTGRAAGSGLGMAIVHELAGAIDGTVDIVTTPGEGTEITVSVPLARPAGALRGP